MKIKLIIYALAATLTVINGAQTQSPAGKAVPVNPDNFIRAESDHYFGNMVKDGSFGKFTHISGTDADRQAACSEIEPRHS